MKCFGDSATKTLMHIGRVLRQCQDLTCIEDKHQGVAAVIRNSFLDGDEIDKQAGYRAGVRTGTSNAVVFIQSEEGHISRCQVRHRIDLIFDLVSQRVRVKN